MISNTSLADPGVQSSIFVLFQNNSFLGIISAPATAEVTDLLVIELGELTEEGDQICISNVMIGRKEEDNGRGQGKAYAVNGDASWVGFDSIGSALLCFAFCGFLSLSSRLNPVD